VLAPVAGVGAALVGIIVSGIAEGMAIIGWVGAAIVVIGVFSVIIPGVGLDGMAMVGPVTGTWAWVEAAGWVGVGAAQPTSRPVKIIKINRRLMVSS
jgi:hypothetical protein